MQMTSYLSSDYVYVNFIGRIGGKFIKFIIEKSKANRKTLYIPQYGQKGAKKIEMNWADYKVGLLCNLFKETYKCFFIV